MLTQNDIINFLRGNKDFFRSEFQITEIGLFGSFARNEQTEKSDIDIIIELEENTRNIFHLKKRLRQIIRENFKREVDICTKKWIKPIFRDYILNEAIYV